MARLFTISFVYNDEFYNTWVTVRTKALYKEYTLNNLDADLLLLLPGNTILSVTPDTFLFPDVLPQHSAGLMRAIIQAVTMHLQTVSDL